MEKAINDVICKLIAWERHTGGSGGHPQLHSKLRDSLGYKKPYLKQKQQSTQRRKMTLYPKMSGYTIL